MASTRKDIAGASQRRPRSNSDERRKEIVRQAASLMDEVGYHNTSMDDIAAQVGLRKPSLYYYFKNKEELLFWIHEEFVDTLIERHTRRLQIEMTPEHRLLELITDLLSMNETHRGYVRVYFENFRVLSSDMLAKVLEKRDVYQGMLQDEIVRGTRSGAFRDVDPFLTSRYLYGACIWSYFWFEGDWRSGAREIAYLFWTQFLDGIRVPDQKGST